MLRPLRDVLDAIMQGVDSLRTLLGSNGEGIPVDLEVVSFVSYHRLLRRQLHCASRRYIPCWPAAVSLWRTAPSSVPLSLGLGG